MWHDAIPVFAESWVGQLLLVYCSVILLHDIAINVLAFFEAHRQIVRQPFTERIKVFANDPPPLSLVIPAHNEAATIVNNTRRLLDLAYPTHEIIVVNDGSSDETLQALIGAFSLRPTRRTVRARVLMDRLRGIYASPHHPSLIVVDMLRAGKTAAMNTALAFARYPYFCVLDAGSVLEHGTMRELTWPFHEDPSTVAVCGVVRPLNGGGSGEQADGASLPLNPLMRFQIIEYFRVMLAARLGLNLIDALSAVPGAIGVFSRDAVMRVGGYRADVFGESLELVARLQRWAARNHRRRAVKFVPRAVCWTKVPETVRTLGHQRSRWHQGLAQALWQSRKLAVSGFRQRYAYLAHVFIELIGPLVEGLATLLFLALLVTGHGNSSFAVFFFFLFVLGRVVNSLLGVALEAVCCPRYRDPRDQATLAAYAFSENFGYLQLTVWWRIRGLLWTLVGHRHGSRVADLEPVASAEPTEEQQAA